MALDPLHNIRAVVIGEDGTGKSSFIVAASTETFSDRVPPVIPPTRLPSDLFPDGVPFTLIDTSSKKEDEDALIEECKQADVILLTYACNDSETLNELSQYWLPLLRQIHISVPIIVIGCKLDLRTSDLPSLENMVAPLMNEFREVEACLECSSLKFIQVPEVIYYAHKTVLFPTAPLFDQIKQVLKPLCVRALKRVFMLCDKDQDGSLSDSEINAFQVFCFSAPLQNAELEGIKRVVGDRLPAGVNEKGLTLLGFFFLHTLFIEQGRVETTWTVLKKFDYDMNLQLKKEIINLPFLNCMEDQSIELSSKGVSFLNELFSKFDVDNTGYLDPSQIEELFSTAPSNPFYEGIYIESVQKKYDGSISLQNFLAQWALMTLIEPKKSLSFLLYCCYPVPLSSSTSSISSSSISSAFQVTRRRKIDRKKSKSNREVIQCFVFGAKSAGKSSILNHLLERPFSSPLFPSTEEKYAAVIVQTKNDIKTSYGKGKFVLVLREINTDNLHNFLQQKDACGCCDVGIFVYDSSNPDSWNECVEILESVAVNTDLQNCEFPSLLIANKDDLQPHPSIFPHSARVCTEMGVRSPIPVSCRLEDVGDLWDQVVSAALKPNTSIPETSSAKSSKATRRLLQTSVTVASVCCIVAVTSLIAYRLYVRHRQSSNA